MQVVDVSTPVGTETEGVILGKAGLYIGLHKVNFPIYSVIPSHLIRPGWQEA